MTAQLLKILPLLSILLIYSGCQQAQPLGAEVLPNASQPSPVPAASDEISHFHWENMRFVVSTPEGPIEIFIRSDGMFEVGEGPDARIFSGFIDEMPLGTLSELLSAQSASFSDRAKCPDDGILSIRLSRFSLHNSCVTPKSALADLLLDLIEEHHLANIPLPCREIILDFQRGYRKLTACESAADCAYLGTDFLPLDAETGSSVLMDDCSRLKPLGVANSFEIVARQREWVLRRDLVTRVCGDKLFRHSCSKSRQLQVNGAPPVCANGECRGNPSLSVHF